jgi:hypothetical protein
MAITKEQAIEVMKQRGYVMTSEAGNASWIGFSKDMNGIWMSANVYLEKEMIDIQCGAGTLKMMCQLSVGKFAFDHPRFDEFEKWGYFYGKVCSEINDVVEQMDYIPQRVAMAAYAMKSEGPVVAPEPEKKKETLEDRVAKFKKAVIAKGKEKGFDPDMCKKFFIYWSEVSDGGKKMRWEIAKTKSGTFNIGGRLVTWRGKDQEYNAKFKDRDEKKAEKQNKELEVKSTVKTKTLF